MSEYDKLIDRMIDACRYCPVCGAELKVVEVKTTIANSGAANGVFLSQDKSCPKGHAVLGIDAGWDPHYGNPQAVFELNSEIFDDKK